MISDLKVDFKIYLLLALEGEGGNELKRTNREDTAAAAAADADDDKHN